MRRYALLIAVPLAVAAPASGAEPTWRLEQPAPPPGARFSVPLGRPGDLQCLAVDRCLMAVEGNATVPRGLLFYDGASWRQLSTVCSGGAQTTRIAWATPDEFWTVTEPSQPRVGAGQALCHVKDGQVVGSFSTANESPDPFRTMDSAACNGPDDCWFGGVGGQDPSGQRVGGFHLHWNGTDLATIYGPQGRGTSDLVPVAGRFYETTFLGSGPENTSQPVNLAQSEAAPVLLHTISGTRFANEPFGAMPQPGQRPTGLELLGADAQGGEAWFVGGGAASGADVPQGGVTPRPPVAVRRDPGSGVPTQVPLPADRFSDTDRFVDVAIPPGTADAMVAVQPFADRGSNTAKATVARITPDGTVTTVTLPTSGSGRGAAAKIDCPDTDECWLLTTAGWLFHLTDGTTHPANGDPAFATRIDFRPNEAAAQFVPDTPPADDSQLFAPPPAELPAALQPPPPTKVTRIKALLFRISKPQVSKSLVLSISFSVRRSRKVQLVARRKGKTVASSPYRRLKPGRHTLRVQLSRKAYPDALRFRTSEKTSSGSSGDDGGPAGTVTTGPDTTGSTTDATPTTGTTGPSDTPPPISTSGPVSTRARP